MKRILVFFFITVRFTVFSDTQTEQDSVQKLTIDTQITDRISNFYRAYFENTLNLDVDALLNKTYPALFTLSPRDAIKNEMEYSFNNPLYEVSFDKMEFKTIKKGFEYQGVKYYITDYYSSFYFKFIKNKDQSNTDFDNYLSGIFPMFVAQMPDQKVERDKNRITISGDKKIIVINDPLLLGFKMLELKPELKVFYTKMLPEAAVEEIFKF